MNTPPDMQQLNAFVDGELDLKSQLDFEARLRSDAALRAQVDGLRQLRSTVREAAEYHRAPPALRERLNTLVAPAATAPLPAASGAAAAVQRWLGWRPMLVSFGAATVLAVSLNLAWLRSAHTDRVLDDVVASHVRSTLGQHLVDVASSDHHTVKPWLSSRLDFSPPVTEAPLPGASFLGGRVDYVDGRPVAALAYRQGQHVVNAFVWPADGKDHAASYSTERGFQIAHWSRSGMHHWVVSDLGHEEFVAFTRALESADAPR
jgi:anti-sigma factor RsiW